MAERDGASGGREPVEVRRSSDGDPERFLWRGRLFVVRTVLDQWVESGTWCLSPVAAGGPDTVRDHDGSTQSRVLALLDSDQALVALGEQRESWLIEASTGRHAAPGVYELSLDPLSGQWALAGGRVSG